VNAEPAVLRAALNWHRAMPGPFLSAREIAGEVVQPVLSVFGSRALQCLHAHGGARPAAPVFVTGTYRQFELDAGRRFRCSFVCSALRDA